MADVKQTIHNIERCTSHVPNACRGCSFSDDKTGVNKDCIDDLLCDALDVIKSQQELIAQYESKCQTCKSRLEGVKPF